MKKIYLVLLFIFICSNAFADGVVYGPLSDTTAYSGWDSNDIAYFAAGVGCKKDTSATSPANLCTTPHIIGQAFCTTEYWSEHDLDISSAPHGGLVCWCRRTHVRVNGELKSDTGPWFLTEPCDDADSCRTYCASYCAAFVNSCNSSKGPIVFLPAY